MLTNPITGVQITEDTELETLAQELREADLLGKPIDKYRKGLKKLINPHLGKLLEDGQETLNDYWIIQRGNRTFDYDLFLANANEQLKQEYDLLKNRISQIEEGFKQNSDPFVKHPKIS